MRIYNNKKNKNKIDLKVFNTDHLMKFLFNLKLP